MLERKMNETPEEVFFKYSADCAYDLFNIGLITREIFDRIKECREQKKVPERSFLESAYPHALKRIRQLADSLGRECWDVEIIRRYFLEEHNRVIENREGLYRDASPAIMELCKVKTGKVTKKETHGNTIVYFVDYGDKTETALGKYLPDVKIGERISTHWKFAIERIK